MASLPFTLRAAAFPRFALTLRLAAMETGPAQRSPRGDGHIVAVTFESLFQVVDRPADAFHLRAGRVGKRRVTPADRAFSFTDRAFPSI